MLISLREDALASLDALRAVIPGILSSPVQLRPLDRSRGRAGNPQTVSEMERRPIRRPQEAVEVEDAASRDTCSTRCGQTGSGGFDY